MSDNHRLDQLKDLASMTSIQKVKVRIMSNAGERQFQMAFDEAKANHKTVKSWLASGQLYEPDVSLAMLRCLEPGDTFIDIGANQGYFTCLAGSIVGKHGRVIGIEPGENNLPDLKRNIQINAFEQCSVLETPLLDSARPVTFFLNGDDSGGNALWDVRDYPGNTATPDTETKRTLQGSTLNEVMTSVAAPVKLIKIDTEGAEESILRGGTLALLESHPPYIITELHKFGLQKMGHSEFTLRSFMRKLGYECFVLGFKGGMPKFIPDGVSINTPFIANLLFCSVESLKLLYPSTELDPRTF